MWEEGTATSIQSKLYWEPCMHRGFHTILTISMQSHKDTVSCNVAILTTTPHKSCFIMSLGSASMGSTNPNPQWSASPELSDTSGGVLQSCLQYFLRPAKATYCRCRPQKHPKGVKRELLVLAKTKVLFQHLQGHF